MSRILLCAATAFEIAPTMERLSQYDGALDVLITGVGMLETAFALAEALAGHPCRTLLQAGIAGCFDPTFPLSAVVAVGSDAPADQGVEEGGAFRSTFALGFGDPDAPPWKAGRLPNESGLPERSGLPVVPAVSVNCISTDSARIAHYRAHSGAVAESMEGAAFHYAARRHGLPFLQVRAFSNYVGERNKSRWQLRESIAALNDSLDPIILQLLPS